MIVLGVWLGLAPGSMALEPPQPAPEFVLPAQSGRTIRLSDLRGQWVYLDFWASWCGPCKQSFPWMNQMHARYRDKGLRVVAIDLDQKIEDGQAFLKRNPVDFEVAFDPKGVTPRLYAVKAMPTSLLISPQGQVQWVHAGFRTEDRADLERRIRSALGLGGTP